MIRRFADRTEGGKALAEKLLGYRNRRDFVVLALPRGGVPVAFEVAQNLNAPLDVFLVRKLGVPFREELAFGAIASGGIKVFNEAIIETFRIPDALIENVLESQQRELERREKLYRAGKSPMYLRNKIVIVVDDGLATGATMRAAVEAIRQLKPKQIIVAAPVASSETGEEIKRKSGDSCVFAITPEPLNGIGMWYQNFQQISDAEVCRLLEKAESNAKFAQAS